MERKNEKKKPKFYTSKISKCIWHNLENDKIKTKTQIKGNNNNKKWKIDLYT